jgi:LysM repeat protein
MVSILLLAAVLAALGSQVLPARAAGEVEYIVRNGDNLSRLAARYGLTVGAILDANPGIVDANRLITGQVIRLPAGRSEGILPRRPARLFPWELEAAGRRVTPLDHLVQVRAGDNYIRIARRFGITVDQFFAANPQIPYRTDLRKGELVYIPVDLIGERQYTFYQSP